MWAGPTLIFFSGAARVVYLENRAPPKKLTDRKILFDLTNREPKHFPRA